jgi:multiple sugar transport system ATP-binding protein
LSGLETPTNGRILFHEEDVTTVPPNKRQVAMMFQHIALYPHMKVWKNIAYPLKVRNVAKTERRKQATEAAEMMHVEELLEKYPAELSGGQRQRIALARLFIQDPELFLMDEPLSDLDANLKVEIRKEIQKFHRQMEKPTVYVTHDQEEALTMSDRIVVMRDGRIEQTGTPDQVYHRPANNFVGSFIGNPNMNLFEGTMTTFTDSEAVVRISDQEIVVPLSEWHVDSPVEAGSPIEIGIRPEQVRIGEEPSDDPHTATIPATVSLVERIGDRMLVTLDGPDDEIRSVTAEIDVAAEDDEIWVYLDGNDAHIFSGDTGDAIARGKRIERSHRERKAIEYDEHSV